MSKQPKTVKNVSVRLLADHQVNGVIRKKGEIIKGYSGPLSANMKLLPAPRPEKTEASVVGSEGAGGSEEK